MDPTNSLAYRRNALKCFALARHISDPEAKQMLMRFAQSWLALSDQAKSFSPAPPHEASPSHSAARPDQGDGKQRRFGILQA